MAVNLSPVGGVAAQFFTNTGAVLTGGKLYTYAAGTTTPAVTYTSSQGVTAWTNPIVLDAAGRVSGSGEIWLTDGINYKFVLKDSTDVLIATYDNISGINSNFVAYTNSQEIQTATSGQTVFTLTTMQYQVGTNSLSVFVDGVNQYGPGAQYAYTETSSTSVTFVSGLHVGAVVKFTSTQQQGAGAVDSSQVTYDPPFTGSVATNVEAKLAQTVSVKDFGAVGNGVADDTDAIQAAIAAIQTAGGGAIYFPTGNYLVQKDSLVNTTTDISLTIYGDGPTASQISCADATVGFVLKNNVAGSNISAFTLRDLGINGPGGASPAGIGLHLQGNQAHVRVENIAFNGLNTCMQLEGVFNSFFSGLRFRNYVIGVQGDPTLAALPAQQNTFTSCYFSFGVNTVPATAYAVKSVNMGQNTYIGCNFEAGGLIKTVDMTGGTGFDTMIGCRFERLNSGTYSWLLLGDNQQIINSTWHVSGTYNTVGTQYALIQAQGFGSSVNEINLSNSNYASNTLLIDAGAKNNYFKFASLLGTDAYDAIFNVVKTVADDDNTIEYPGGGSEKYTSSDLYDTWGGGGVNQLVTDSLALSTFTFDGLTNSAGPGGSTPEALGPQQDGYTRNLNTPTGNKKAYFTYSATNNYVYIWSIWVLAKTANDTVDLAVGSSLGSPVWRTFTLNSTTKWQRIFMAVRATSTANIYAQLRANGASGVYAFGPQLEEWLPTSGRFGPSGYVRSSTGISYQMNPAPMQKNQIWGTAIPTVGTYTQGDIIWNLDAASGGAPGWMCTVSGSPGTWKAMANLA